MCWYLKWGQTPMRKADLLLVPLTREEAEDQNRPVIRLGHPGREQ